MTTELFGRVCSVDVQRSDGQTVSIRGARVAFDVKRDATLHANTAEIRIWNLAASTRARFALPATVTLNAGFLDTAGAIFVGTVYDVATTWSCADTITMVKAVDTATGRIALSRAGSVAWSVVARALVSAATDVARVRPGNALAAIGAARGATYPRGFSCSGPCLIELSRVLEVAGLSVSVQAGELLVLSAGDALGPGQVIAISPASGLVGEPVLAVHKAPGAPAATAAQPQKGHMLKALLQTRIAPGSVVAVQSQVLSGQFRVRSVGHSGDSEGTEWFSQLELQP